MFGHHQAKRQKRRNEREMTNFRQEQNQFGKEAQEREKVANDVKNQQVAEKAAEAKLNRQKAREEGRSDLEAFLKKEVQGLDPETRKALQYEANKSIHRAHQSENRKLLGDQAQRGIVGKGGVGFAQQKDLQRMAMEAEGQAYRDLTKLDQDLALKNKAAMFAGGEGNAALEQLDRQAALDELNLIEERKRQQAFENKFNHLFSRI